MQKCTQIHLHKHTLSLTETHTGTHTLCPLCVFVYLFCAPLDLSLSCSRSNPPLCSHHQALQVVHQLKLPLAFHFTPNYVINDLQYRPHKWSSVLAQGSATETDPGTNPWAWACWDNQFANSPIIYHLEGRADGAVPNCQIWRLGRANWHLGTSPTANFGWWEEEKGGGGLRATTKPPARNKGVCKEPCLNGESEKSC